MTDRTVAVFCHDCGGEGHVPRGLNTCQRCGGEGEKTVSLKPDQVPCPKCDGDGRDNGFAIVENQRCGRCNGEGFVKAPVKKPFHAGPMVAVWESGGKAYPPPVIEVPFTARGDREKTYFVYRLVGRKR